MDYTGRIKAYAVVDLRVMGIYDWRLSERSVWKVERMLLDWPHRRITSSDARIDALRKRYVGVPRGARLQAVEVLQGPRALDASAAGVRSRG